MYLFLGIVASAPTRYSSEMGSAAAGYRPRAPEQGALHTVVRTHLEAFLRAAAERTDGAGLPRFVEDEFRDFLTCGVLEHGFARLRCEGCGLDHPLPFSCKGRGFCPSCEGRRMTERAAHAVDAVLPPVPVRQWVLSLLHWLRYVLAWNHGLCRAVLAVYVQALLGFQRQRARRLGVRDGRSGSLTVIQRFAGTGGGALGARSRHHRHRIGVSPPLLVPFPRSLVSVRRQPKGSPRGDAGQAADHRRRLCALSRPSPGNTRTPRPLRDSA